MTPDIVANTHDACGENPLWHPDENVLYWTDIPDGELYRFDPATGTSEKVYQGDPIGGFTLQADGSLLLFQKHGAIRAWKDGKIVKTLCDFIAKEDETRWNDVIADPQGRVYGGTMPANGNLGRFYRINLDGSYDLLLTGIGCSNGMGFTRDRRHFYYTDTTPGHIYRFDYVEATGHLSNQRLVVQVPKGEGGPDGMTLDADGTIWSARWGGSAIHHYTADGANLGIINLPTANITCLTYGGADLRDVYITSAGGGKPDSDEAAGALFHYRANVPGLPEYRSKISF